MEDGMINITLFRRPLPIDRPSIQAPGEAEAELAYLNRIRVIDGILSDDVDTFLFGGLTVIRK